MNSKNTFSKCFKDSYSKVELIGNMLNVRIAILYRMSVVNRLGGDITCKNESRRKNKICLLKPLFLMKIEFENLSSILKFG